MPQLCLVGLLLAILLQKHGSTSGNSVRRSGTTTTYNNGAIRSTITTMEDVCFFIYNPSLSAIGRVRLLESWSVVIVDVDQTTRDVVLRQVGVWDIVLRLVTV